MNWSFNAAGIFAFKSLNSGLPSSELNFFSLSPFEL